MTLPSSHRMQHDDAQRALPLPPAFDLRSFHPKSTSAFQGCLRRMSFSNSQTDLEVILGRIRWHAKRLEKPGISANEKLVRLRSIIRSAQDEYDRVLSEEDAKNFVVSDPTITEQFGGIVE